MAVSRNGTGRAIPTLMPPGRRRIARAALGAPVDVIGHSFGATVALRLALERPELVRSLVLVEPVLFAAAKAAEDPRFAAFAAREGCFGPCWRRAVQKRRPKPF